MKNNVLYMGLIAALFFGLTSCEEEMKTIEGNGVVSKEVRVVQEFSEIQVDGIINVFLRRGESQLVEIESDENLQDIVKVECLDGNLKIYVSEETSFDATKMNAYVRTPSIEKITLHGITNLTTENTFRQTSISIDKDNTGNLTFDGEIAYFWLNAYGIGNVTLRGKAERSIINFASTGNLMASEFHSDIMELDKSGTGMANIWVDEVLKLILDGVGDVYCTGDPQLVEKDIAGLGRLLMVVE